MRRDPTNADANDPANTHHNTSVDAHDPTDRTRAHYVEHPAMWSKKTMRDESK